MVPAWAQAFIGIPYKDKGRDRDGVDCWGLLRLVYQSIHGIDLPSYTDEYETADNASAALNKKNMHAWKKTELKAGTAVLIKMMDQPRHVGYMVTDHLMLHSQKGHDSAIESINTVKWRNRIIGAYTYAA